MHFVAFEWYEMMRFVTYGRGKNALLYITGRGRQSALLHREAASTVHAVVKIQGRHIGNTLTRTTMGLSSARRT